MDEITRSNLHNLHSKIRYDIIQSLRNVYNEVKDETIREKALELIETEADIKYRKKYAGVWRVK